METAGDVALLAAIALLLLLTLAAAVRERIARA